MRINQFIWEDFNMGEKELTGYPSIDKPWLKYYSEEAINAQLPECTIYEYMKNRNQDNLNNVAINYFDKKISYKELFDNIQNWQGLLLNLV